MMSAQGTHDPNSLDGLCTITRCPYNTASDPKTPRSYQDYRSKAQCLPENLGIFYPKERYVPGSFKSSANYHHVHTCYTVSSQDDPYDRDADSYQLTVPQNKPAPLDLRTGAMPRLMIL